MFWFDTNMYYKRLTKYISSMNSFSEVKSSTHWRASFKKLADEKHCLDLAINWVTDSKSVMFSTWIKHGFETKECVNTTESSQPKCARKSKKCSKKKGQKKEICRPKNIRRLIMISCEMPQQQSNMWHLPFQHSSLDIVPSVSRGQTVDSFSLNNVKTIETTMSNQSNHVRLPIRPKKPQRKKK